MSYRFLEHTADVALEASAETLPELFSEALRGMTDVVTDVETIAAKVERSIEAEADRPDLLLLEFLSEILFRFEVHQELFRAARLEVVEDAGGWRLSGIASGETLDPERHPMKVMIKAVTYHELQVERDEGLWRARVIFDI